MTERAGCTVKMTTGVMLLFLNGPANDDCMLKMMDQIDWAA